MPTQILMPKLGLTITEGTIVEWVAGEGQAVAAGDIVMLIETDKVEAEVEAVELSYRKVPVPLMGAAVEQSSPWANAGALKRQAPASRPAARRWSEFILVG